MLLFLVTLFEIFNFDINYILNGYISIKHIIPMVTFNQFARYKICILVPCAFQDNCPIIVALPYSLEIMYVHPVKILGAIIK